MNEIDPVPTSSPTANRPVAAAGAVDVGVSVRCDAWSGAGPDVMGVCRRAAVAAVDEGAALAGRGAELSVVLAADGFLRELNLRYRQRDAATNVLSFSASGGPDDADSANGLGPLLLGDVVIAYETVSREAAEQSKTLSDHLAHLVVHGVLHLLGYDHENGDDAVAMENLEIRILAGLGIADPYRVEGLGGPEKSGGRSP